MSRFARRMYRNSEDKAIPMPDLPEPPQWAIEAEQRQREALRDIHLAKAERLRAEADLVEAEHQLKNATRSDEPD